MPVILGGNTGIYLASSTPPAPSFVGLLDTYPNAAVAYSLRKLSSTYSGNCIRVRRSSDNTEQDFGFVNNVLDTASLLTFVGAGSGYITTWYDQSGNGNGRNITQSTATSQPMIIVAGALVTRGGKPAVSFFDPIANLNNSLINSAIGFPVNNVSHFAVSSKRINGANLRAIYSTGILGPFDGFGLFYNTDETLYYQARSGAAVNGGGAYANVNNTNNLIFGVLQPVTDNHWFNGANNVATANTRPNANSTSPLTIGNIAPINWPHNGTISEVVFWSANQTTNRTGIESNVNSFYTIYSSGPTWNGTQTGLLNTYPGAAAAYSVRALNSAYTGPLIRVRRSSDNNEIDIFALQNGELDTTFLLTFCGAGNGFVTTWYDQSGNANAANATATAQPQIVSSGSLITTNGKVSLDFDGTNDRLGFTQITGSTGLTLISVNKYDVISSGSSPWDGSTTITGYSSGFVQDAGLGARIGRSSFYYENNTPLEITGGAGSAVINTQYLQFAYGSSTAAGQAMNGTLVTGTAGRNDLIVRAIANDNSQLTHTYFNGTIQEAIVYTTNKASDRTGIQTNINSYYNIY